MASIFGHALAASTLSLATPKTQRTVKLIVLGIFCSILPDADVVTFSFGIPYESMLGHRGFTHSIVFALLLPFAVLIFFFSAKKLFSASWWIAYSFFVLATLSHGVLDACTTGGLGVGFFIPFSAERFFFPWHPIKVSPIGASKFFSEWGLKVLASEALFIGLPAICAYVLAKTISKFRAIWNRPQ